MLIRVPAHGLAMLIACTTAAIQGCETRSESVASKASEAELVAPYPPGRWRLVPLEELAHTVLWMSQILVRHQDVTPLVVSFKAPFWFSAPPAPQRTRAEGLRLAQSIAERARANPAQFAALAAQHSEDVASRDAGGDLGGVTAVELTRSSPQVLDALAAIRPGEVSQVIESMYGFHVLLRRQPPPEETVSGVRIVIAHDQAPWLRTYLARRNIPSRSRAEALELAQSLYRQGLADPSKFEHLVREYSEHVDALRGGDMGTWSTHEPVPQPVEMEALRSVPVGGIAPPFDSLFGIQIVQRTTNRPRPIYAMAAIRLTFDPSGSPSDSGFSENVLLQAKALSQRLSSTPSLFSTLLEEYEPLPAERWVEGRKSAAIEAAVKELGVGQIASEPVRVDSLGGFLLVKRLDPADLPAPVHTPTRFDLPAPAEPALAYLVSEELSPPLVRSTVLQLEKEAAALVGDDREAAHQISKVHDLSDTFRDNLQSEELAMVFTEFVARVRALLGESKFERYKKVMNNRFEALVLRTPGRAS